MQTDYGSLRIRTPEGVTFAYQLAGPASRMLALLIDFTCAVGATIIVGLGVSLLKILSPDAAKAIYVVLYFVISTGYGIALEWLWRGQTIGKRVLRLRVMDAQGLHLQWNQVVLRNLLRFVDALPVLYLVGGAVSMFTRNGQRLGDLAANTVVIRTVKVADPDVTQLIRGRFNSMLAYPHLCARLRQRTPPAAAGVGLEALTRRDEFDPLSRVELFSEIAAYYRLVVEFPAEAVEQISDEQYVRNVVEILFQPAVSARSRSTAPLMS
jgi:uncharacterized RDD family membrane protein YckC